MKNQLNGFVDFVREQGVIGLAIGLILGIAVKDVVDGLVEGIVSPVIGLIIPNAETLAEASVKIGDTELIWGLFASSLIDLSVIAALIYFVVKGIGLDKLDKLDKKKES